MDEIWVAESAADTIWVWTNLNDTDDVIMLRQRCNLVLLC